MTSLSTSPLAQPSPDQEHALLGFSLRLHLLYRGLLRASLGTGDMVPWWTGCAAEAVNDLHHEFVVFTRARLEQPFAAMHGREMRRWEEHLADIIRRSECEDACSRDLLDEMKGIVESGEELLPHLRNGTAKEMALMLSRYRRSLARIEASEPLGATRGFFPRSEGDLLPQEWDRVLSAIRCEQCGDFAPVKLGSWRCLETALGEVAESLPVRPARPHLSSPVNLMVPGQEATTGGGSGVMDFSLTVRERVPLNVRLVRP